VIQLSGIFNKNKSIKFSDDRKVQIQMKLFR